MAGTDDWLYNDDLEVQLSAEVRDTAFFVGKSVRFVSVKFQEVASCFEAKNFSCPQGNKS